MRVVRHILRLVIYDVASVLLRYGQRVADNSIASNDAKRKRVRLCRIKRANAG